MTKFSTNSGLMQLEVSAAHMQARVSAANIWVVIFNVYKYAYGSLCCSYAGGIFCSAL